MCEYLLRVMLTSLLADCSCFIVAVVAGKSSESDVPIIFGYAFGRHLYSAGAICYNEKPGRLAQLVRALRLHRRSRGFEPLIAHPEHTAILTATPLLLSYALLGAARLLCRVLSACREKQMLMPSFSLHAEEVEIDIEFVSRFAGGRGHTLSQTLMSIPY